MGFLLDTNVLSEMRKDGPIAATAIAHELILVTRNTRDVARTAVKLINPFEELSAEP